MHVNTTHCKTQLIS